MEAWEAMISDAVSQAVSKAEQSYMQNSVSDSIVFWSILMVIFKISTLFRWIRELSLRGNIEMG